MSSCLVLSEHFVLSSVPYGNVDNSLCSPEEATKTQRNWATSPGSPRSVRHQGLVLAASRPLVPFQLATSVLGWRSFPWLKMYEVSKGRACRSQTALAIPGQQRAPWCQIWSLPVRTFPAARGWGHPRLGLGLQVKARAKVMAGPWEKFSGTTCSSLLWDEL